MFFLSQTDHRIILYYSERPLLRKAQPRNEELMRLYEPKNSSGEVMRYEYGLSGATLEHVMMRLRASNFFAFNLCIGIRSARRISQ